MLYIAIIEYLEGDKLRQMTHERDCDDRAQMLHEIEHPDIKHVLEFDPVSWVTNDILPDLAREYLMADGPKLPHLIELAGPLEPSSSDREHNPITLPGRQFAAA